MKTTLQSSPLPTLGLREAARWIGAGTVALALHSGGVWYSGQFQSAEALSEPPPSVVMMDLAPLVVESQSVAAEEAPAVETAETVTEASTADEIEPIEEEQAELVTEALPEPIIEEIRPEPVQEAMAQVEEEIPEAPEAPKPEVIVPKRIEHLEPVEKPKPRVTEKPKPKPKVVNKPKRDKKVIAEAEAQKKKKAADRAAAKEAALAKVAAGKAVAAKAAAAAKSAKASSTARSGGGGGMSVSSWGSKVNAHMQRRKRRGDASGSGTVYVSFSINSSGGVTSASVARSSGNSALDGAALALIRRASPVPAPPPNAPRSLTIPIQY